LFKTVSKSEKSLRISEICPKAETLNSVGDIGVGVGDAVAEADGSVVADADSAGVGSLLGDCVTIGVGAADSVPEDVSVVEESVFPPSALKNAITTTKVAIRRRAFLPLLSPGFPVANCHNGLIFEPPEGEAELMTLWDGDSDKTLIARRLLVHALPSQYLSVSTKSVSGYHPATRASGL
jgi:hypothetical protein